MVVEVPQGTEQNPAYRPSGQFLFRKVAIYARLENRNFGQASQTMKKRHKFLFIVLVLVVGIVAAWKIAYPTNSFRYKLTVNVETPEGLKSGYAVREFTVFQQPEIGDSGPGNSVRGEAVVVDLGSRGLLFALIHPDDEYLVFKTFPGPPGLTREGARYYESLVGKSAMNPDHYPKMVAFKDINDAKTVSIAYKATRGYKNENNVETLFGTGVSLKDVTIEMTREKVTRNIDKYLPSFGQDNGFSDWYRKLANNDPRRITQDNFSR